jgi:type IV fimbrial biogenesis protein FimT
MNGCQQIVVAGTIRHMCDQPVLLRRRRQHLGFTLLELLVTTIVLAVVMAIALPSMRDLIVGNRLSSSVNSFIGLINYARSEAIARNQDVMVCPKASGAITCTSTTSWNTHDIQAFVDEDGSGQINGAELVLKTIAAVDPSDSNTAFDQGSNVALVFGSAGFARNAESFKIYVKSDDATYVSRFGRTVCVSKAGRVRVVAYTVATCPDF